MQKSIVLAAAVMLVALSAPMSARAQSGPSSAAQSEAQRTAELAAAWQAAGKAGTSGPAEITLIDQAVLKISADDFFVPKTEGARVMRALGNVVNDASFVGLVVGKKQDEEWIVVARHIKEGYIKDDDAKSWNAGDLLQHIKEGTEEANKDRAARGFPEMEVLGWVEQPAYDAGTHRLVWSLLAKLKGQADDAPKGINYNTYALGRDGYFSLNLLSSSERIASEKAIAHELLANLSYNSGKRYEDFNATTDHIAEYGLIALVGGIAAKKLGLLALVAALAIKFAKVIAVGAFVLGASVLRFFRRKPSGGPADGDA
jgi:uncharacterized membrane-anchored protein